MFTNFMMRYLRDLPGQQQRQQSFATPPPPYMPHQRSGFSAPIGGLFSSGFAQQPQQPPAPATMQPMTGGPMAVPMGQPELMKPGSRPTGPGQPPVMNALNRPAVRRGTFRSGFY